MNTDLTKDAPGDRKPRLALMGEFSAGKSTLSNLLLGCSPLPVRVTATRLPPVWMSYGEEDARRVDMDGVEHPLNIDDLSDIRLDETRMIKLFLKADALEICDLIDMPGISDPNMSATVWQSVFSEVDSVVWCTHATQAWRQSEAAVWESIQDQTNGDNLLVISQFDKLRSERDQSRVLGRVEKETEGQFKGVFPVSLLQALGAENDIEQWQQSGAARFTDVLVEMLLNPQARVHKPVEDAQGDSQTAPETPNDADDAEAKAGTAENTEIRKDTPSPIRPRRIKAAPSNQPTNRLPAGSVMGTDIRQMALEVGQGD